MALSRATNLGWLQSDPGAKARATPSGWVQQWYQSPANFLVNFNFGGSAYTAPTGSAVAFVFNPPLTPVYKARPTADTATGAWTPSTGSTLYGCIDETSYDDADYIATQTSAVCTMTLGSLNDPGSSGGHVIKFRAKSLNSNTLTVTLKQGGTTIKTATTAALTSSFADYTMTLTGAEADSITDYTALTITLQANT